MYYIQGAWGDENSFAVLYVSLCYGPYTLFIKQQFFTFITFNPQMARYRYEMYVNLNFIYEVKNFIKHLGLHEDFPVLIADSEERESLNITTFRLYPYFS